MRRPCRSWRRSWKCVKNRKSLRRGASITNSLRSSLTCYSANPVSLLWWGRDGSLLQAVGASPALADPQYHHCPSPSWEEGTGWRSFPAAVDHPPTLALPQSRTLLTHPKTLKQGTHEMPSCCFTVCLYPGPSNVALDQWSHTGWDHTSSLACLLTQTQDGIVVLFGEIQTLWWFLFFSQCMKYCMSLFVLSCGPLKKRFRRLFIVV